MTSTEREAVHRARSAVASAALPRRRQNPARAPDVSQAAFAWVDTAAAALSASDFSTSREDGCGLPGVGLPFPLPPEPSPRSCIIER